jgi:hypothetical protein
MKGRESIPYFTSTKSYFKKSLKGFMSNGKPTQGLCKLGSVIINVDENRNQLTVITDNL